MALNSLKPLFEELSTKLLLIVTRDGLNSVKPITQLPTEICAWQPKLKKKKKKLAKWHAYISCNDGSLIPQGTAVIFGDIYFQGQNMAIFILDSLQGLLFCCCQAYNKHEYPRDRKHAICWQMVGTESTKTTLCHEPNAASPRGRRYGLTTHFL